MVIFHSYVSLPEGIWLYIYIYEIYNYHHLPEQIHPNVGKYTSTMVCIWDKNTNITSLNSA